MAQLTDLKKGIKDIHDYELRLKHDDRIKVVVNGEYVTYILCHDGTLMYLDSPQVEML